MTNSSFLRLLALSAVVVAAPVGAQGTAQPAPPSRPAPPQPVQPTFVPLRVQPRAIPPAPLPALRSAMQAPTRPVIAPPSRVIPDTARMAVQSAAPVAAIASVAASQPAPPPPRAVAPLPVTNLPSSAPANATGRCKDGTYLTGTTATDANCSSHGGLGVIFPAPSRPPQRTLLRKQ
jgi:hypothetical protein